MTGLHSLASRGAVFLDRDGVMIENREEYVKSWQDMPFVPSLEALPRLEGSDRRLMLITNQSLTGRGVAAVEDVVRLHQRLVREIERHGGRIDPSNLRKQSRIRASILPIRARLAKRLPIRGAHGRPERMESSRSPNEGTLNSWRWRRRTSPAALPAPSVGTACSQSGSS